jgi:hypothetical protein
MSSAAASPRSISIATGSSPAKRATGSLGVAADADLQVAE